MASPSPQHSQMDPSISLNFRAPPPSPVPSNRRSSSVTNDDILTDFLAHTLRVPDLILPDRIFPKQIRPSPDIPVVDFKVLDSLAGTVIRDSLASIGCFELVNHEAAMVAEAGGVFRVSSAGKRKAARAAPEAEYGYEVMGEEEEEEMSEEFVWGRDSGFKIKMEEIWPRYSNFSEKMEILSTQIEKVARNIMLVLLDDHNDNNNMNNKAKHGKGPTSVCYIHKHPRGISADRCISSLRYDVIRMMIKGSDYSHALSFHLCEESTEFHVYSKRGWLSFIPTPHSLVVTAGDQIQLRSNGEYKHVIGRPIYVDKDEDCISMAFLCSLPTTSVATTTSPVTTDIATDTTITNVGTITKSHQEKIISLKEQAMFAICLTLLYHFLLFIYNNI